MAHLPIRPRRLRQSEALRVLVRETSAPPSHLLAEWTAHRSQDDALPAGLGGVWAAPMGTRADLEQTALTARQSAPHACVAVDVRGVDADAATAAAVARAAGADLVAVRGEDTAAVRLALESAGDVLAVLVACVRLDWLASEEPDLHAWVQAGADLVLMEPALPNLDRIHAASAALAVPVIARCTPEEAASYQAAFDQGWLDGDTIPAEVVVGIRRAGARMAVVPWPWAQALGKGAT